MWIVRSLLFFRRYRLRTLFIIMTLLAVGMGFWSRYERLQALANYHLNEERRTFTEGWGMRFIKAPEYVKAMLELNHFHRRMYDKYEEAARHPWRPVAPDPPKPPEPVDLR